MDNYFTDDKIFYTEGDLKLKTLQKLGSTLHYDDSLEEISNNFGKIKTISPYDKYPDSSEVGKAIIYDKDDRILILRRTDEGKKWDIPGGHFKKLKKNDQMEKLKELSVKLWKRLVFYYHF